ncbi:MAG: metal-dependent hydrolase [Pseudomonadota bacterium]
MDNLTHGLTGALMAQTGLKRKTGLGLAALVLGANLPDIDVVGLLWLDSTEALGFRRGITHGPIGVALLPLGLAALLWGFDRWQDRRCKRPKGRDPVRFGWLYALGLIGAISHTLMDWLNVYGVRFLYPFDTSWYYGDTLFIIDVWLWALLIGFVWWSARAEKRDGNGQRPAWLGVVAGLAFIALNYAITWFDYNTGGRMAEPYPQRFITSPVPLAFWSREHIAQLSNGEWIANRWDGQDYEYGYRRSAAQQCALPDRLNMLRKARPQLNAYLTWSRAPFAERAEDGSVILRDARFYDPLARDRFSLALPDVKCVELPEL